MLHSSLERERDGEIERDIYGNTDLDNGLILTRQTDGQTGEEEI